MMFAKGKNGGATILRRLMIVGFLLGSCGPAEAKWTGVMEGGWTLVLSDGTWTVRCYHLPAADYDNLRDFDGNQLESPQVFHSITQAPEGGGELDMSTMYEDLVEAGHPTWKPGAMYGNFYSFLQSKKVTSFKLPSCMKVISGWSASGATGAYNSFTTNVVCQSGLDVIGAGFFSYMTNLVSVTGIDTVREIKETAFRDCFKLTTVSPLLPTGVVSVAENAFWNCSNLKGELRFQSPVMQDVRVNFNTGSNGKTKLSSIYYGEGVTNVNHTWMNCTTITNIAPYPSTLKSIGGCFYQCNSPVKLDFSACTNLTEIPGDFANYSKLTEVILPPRIRSIGKSAFLNSAITNVGYVADKRFRDEMLETSGTVGDNAFRLCVSLREVEFPWGGSETTLGSGLVAGCWQLKRLKFDGRAPKSWPQNLFDGVPGQVGVTASYCVQICCSRQRDREGWRAFATRTTLTDEERARANYPGKGTFGVYDSFPDGDHRYQWMVWTPGCWDEPQGLMLLLR